MVGNGPVDKGQRKIFNLVAEVAFRKHHIKSRGDWEWL